MSEHKGIPISLPSVGQEEWQALRGPIESGWLTQGPRVREFEEAFGALVGTSHAVATTSCTTALHLALVALGIKPGDEVLVPAFTWIATANVVMYCGATPVFVDVDPSTFNVDAESMANARTERTRAAIPVHLFGLCADVDAIRAALPGVSIVEDAACAVGASYDGTPAGALGDVAAFSFHPRKIITTGEGGMLTTSDSRLAEIAVKLRNHGAEIAEEERHVGPRPYILPDFNLLGFNYRMTDLQGVLGLVQLKKLEAFRREREHQARRYTAALRDLEWLLPPQVPPNAVHGWQSYVCRIDEARAPLSRNELMQRLDERGISTRPGTHALHTLGLYKRHGSDGAREYPGALQCAETSLALPLHNRLDSEAQDRIIAELHALSDG